MSGSFNKFSWVIFMRLRPKNFAKQPPASLKSARAQNCERTRTLRFVIEVVHKARVNKRECVRKMVGVKMRDEKNVDFVEVYAARNEFCKTRMTAVEKNFLFVDFKKIARRPPFFSGHHGSGAEDG